MPGWSAIPVVGGDDMSLRSTYLELMNAWNERSQAIGLGTLSNPAAGDPCLDSAAAYAIAAMQQWIETNCVSFVVSHTGSPPTELANGYYAGAGTIPMYTLASFRSTAGLNASGFKKTVAPTYGIAAAGDDVLVDHFNELRLAFNVLKWTLSEAAYDNHGENNDRTANTTGFLGTWNAAYADALTNYNAATAAANNNPNVTALCAGSISFGSYNCTLARRYLYGEFTGIPTHVSHEMDAYLFTKVPQLDEANATFFDHGDGTLDSVFYLIQSFASAATATRTTGKIGSIAIAPSQGPAPTATPPTAGTYGWESQPGRGGTTFPQGVIRWGFTYS